MLIPMQMPRKNSPKNQAIRVTYIVATKNRVKYLKKSLENIREFITKQDELIIMDGGSTDGTKVLLEKNRDIISYFESETDFGEAHALNKAVLVSKGKYIKMLTDDDYIYPKAIKFAIKVLENNPEIDALHCGGEAYIYNEKTKKEEVLFYEQVFPGVEIARDLLHVTTYCPCGLGLILRRRIIPRAGLFDTSFLASDLGYISKLIQCKANFKYLNISLYKHINYAHSGEKFIPQIHRDEARVYLDHHLWEMVMGVETEVLKEVLGLDKVDKGTELLRSIKFLDFLRRKGIYLPIMLLDFISRQRKFPSRIMAKIFPRKSAIQQSPRPVPPVRNNKFW